LSLRTQILEIITREEELSEIIQLVGKSALSEPDKATLDVAGVVKEDFLQQNGYSAWDKYCPMYKTAFMMKGIIAYYQEALQAIQNGVTWNKTREATHDVFYELSQMKFQNHDVEGGKENLTKYFEDLNKKIADAFRDLSE
jgi:vacuolar-type H+-ATPase catalytic subunit A/Vma1